MGKADYRHISVTYDVSRRLLEENSELWIELISERIGSHQKVDLLDLGCGTGRFSIPIATKLGYSVTGTDISKEMILKAREKKGESQIRWVIEDATMLSFPDCSFDAVFMSHLLHHVGDHLSVLKECYRILKSEGTILNRYGAMENIRDDPEHRFFPEAVELDEARIPTIKQVEKWFRATGFNDVSSETIAQQTYRSADEILRKAELKSTSVLTLISQPAFEHGLRALREYISSNPNDPWLFLDKLTLTTGKK